MSSAYELTRPPAPADFLSGGGEMGARLRAYDWAKSPLGEPSSWPRSQKTAVRIMLTSRQPIWIGWGRELIYLYNDAYKSIIGGKHPWALGRPTAEVWREIWTEIEPMLATAMQGRRRRAGRTGIRARGRRLRHSRAAARNPRQSWRLWQ